MTHRLSALSRSSDALKPYTSRTTLELDDGSHHAGYGSSASRPAPSSPSGPNPNQILAALPAADLARLSPHLELVPLSLGEMLYEPGRQQQYAYFPTTSVVSLHYVMECGATAEAAGVGYEGVVGISLFMGRHTTPSSAVVQNAGHAYRLPGRLLLQEFERAGAMQRLLLRYTQALIAQMVLTSACNRHHLVEQQLSRFLLLTIHRAHSRELVMTQELVGNLIGVRREGIGVAAARLARAGLIGWRRGHVTVLEPSGLEARACECYFMVKAELSRLRSDLQASRDLPTSDSPFLPAEAIGGVASKPSAPATLANWHRGNHRQRGAMAAQPSFFATSP